jgi:hypothetical protein
MSRKRQSFVQFCETVLKIVFTVPWRTLARVTIDGVQPRDLCAEEREAARALFGDVDEIDPRIRRVLVWRLGRAAGKSTIAAALAIYSAWTSDLSRVGRGHVPAAFVVSPTKPVAKIAIGVARELLRGTALDRFVTDDTTHGFLLLRPDKRLVEIACVAASRGGASLRGRDVVVLVVDESEFMGSDEGGAAVTDADQINAVMPRLLGYALCISTPWPTANVTAEYFDRNHGHPIDAVVALGTSMFMRPSEQLALDIAREMARDEENALREYECIPGARGGSRLFDAEAVDACIVEGRPLVIVAPKGSCLGAGGDLAMERDSSTIAIVSRLVDSYELLEADEVRPTKAAPLTPGYVVRDRFVPVLARYGVKDLALDQHYRRSAEEHLEALGCRLVAAEDTNQFKYETHMQLRAILRSGNLRIPRMPRLVVQLKAVTVTPMAGGRSKISSPRRAGQGHGDLVSALVLAVWRAQRETKAHDAPPLRVGPPTITHVHGGTLTTWPGGGSLFTGGGGDEQTVGGGEH